MQNTFFKKKILTPFSAILLALVLMAAAVGGTYFALQSQNPAPSTPEALFDAATKDAVFAEPDEVLPLVNLDKNDKMVRWNEAGDKVLLLSWHKYPDSYPTGEDISFQWGEVWTFTDKEIAAWYQKNQNGVQDWTLRLEQLIGLPPGAGYTHFSAFWVNPEDVIRPAYVTDATQPMALTTLNAGEEASEFDNWYKEWFDGNIIWSYFDSQYPWTRLGYTYDWSGGKTDYGLSEFLILKDAPANVEFTLSNEEFMEWIKSQNG